jgi:hypothetical protein
MMNDYQMIKMNQNDGNQNRSCRAHRDIRKRQNLFCSYRGPAKCFEIFLEILLSRKDEFQPQDSAAAAAAAVYSILRQR